MNYNSYNFRLEIYKKITKKNNFVNADVVWLKKFAKHYSIQKNDINLYRAYFRVLNTKQGFYFNFQSLLKKKNFFFMLKNTFLNGLKYVWLSLRF